MSTSANSIPSRCMSFFNRTQYPHQVVVYMVTAVGAAVIEEVLLVDRGVRRRVLRPL
jgi:hypothetical protein